MLNIYDYQIARESEPSYYQVNVQTDTGTTSFSLKAKGRIIIEHGHITSINGNGCSVRDFRSMIERFDAYRSFDKAKETQVLNALEELVCKNESHKQF